MKFLAFLLLFTSLPASLYSSGSSLKKFSFTPSFSLFSSKPSFKKYYGLYLLASSILAPILMPLMLKEKGANAIKDIKDAFKEIYYGVFAEKKSTYSDPCLTTGAPRSFFSKLKEQFLRSLFILHFWLFIPLLK